MFVAVWGERPGPTFDRSFIECLVKQVLESLVVRPRSPVQRLRVTGAAFRRGAEWVASWTPLGDLEQTPPVSSPEEMEAKCRRVSRAYPDITGAVVTRIVDCERVRARLVGRQRQVDLCSALVSLLFVLGIAVSWLTYSAGGAEAPTPAGYLPGLVAASAASFLGISGVSRVLRRRRMPIRALITPLVALFFALSASSLIHPVPGDTPSWIWAVTMEGLLFGVGMLLLLHPVQAICYGLWIRGLAKDELQAGEAPAVGGLVHVVHSHTLRTPAEMGVEDQERHDAWMRNVYRPLTGTMHRAYPTTNKRMAVEQHECFLEAAAALRDAEAALARRDNRDLTYFDTIAIQTVVALLDRNWSLLPSAPRHSRLSPELHVIKHWVEYVSVFVAASVGFFVKYELSPGNWVTFAVVTFYVASFIRMIIAERERPPRVIHKR